MFKRSWLLLLVMIAVAGPVAVVTPMAVSPASAAETDDEAGFVALINQLRTSQGLGPLEVHPELVQPARSWAAQLASNGSLSHATDLSVGISGYWTKLGENVGVGPQGQVNQLFQAFVDSPPHYANLVDPGFRYVGVGVVYDAEGRIWTTHRFLALGDAPPTTAPPTTTSAVPTTAPSTAPIDTTADTRPPGRADDEQPGTLAFNDAAELDETALATIVASLGDAGI